MKKIFNALILVSLLAMQNSLAIDFKENTLASNLEITGRYSIGDLNNDGFDDIFYSGIEVFPCEHRFQNPGCDHPSLHTLPKVMINNQKGGFFEVKQSHDITTSNSNFGTSYIFSYHSKIVDINNDGINDIITSLGEVYINDGTGNMELSIEIDFAHLNKPVFSSDLDNDGVKEVLFNGVVYKRISVNTYAFEEVDQSLLWKDDQDIKLADFNHDGFVDIIVYGNEDNIEILINNQEGVFLPADKVVLNHAEPLNLLVGDIDHDNDNDIILSNGRELLNNSDNSDFDFVINETNFNIPQPFAGPFTNDSNFQAMIPIEFIDFNGDEYDDVLVSFYQDGNDSRFSDFILINRGQGLFELEEINHKTLTIKGNSLSIVGQFDGSAGDDLLITSMQLIADGGFLPGSVLNYSIKGRNYPKIISTYANSYKIKPSRDISVNPRGMINSSKSFLFDYENDGVKEIIQSNYYRYTDYLSFNVDYSPYYLADLESENFTIKNIGAISPMLDAQGDTGRLIIPADFNNDGLDDLYVKSVEVNFSSINSIDTVYINSTSGYDANNTISFVDSNASIDAQPIVADINRDGYADIIIDEVLYINNNGDSFQKHNLNGVKLGKAIGDIYKNGKYYFELPGEEGFQGLKIGYIDENYLVIEEYIRTRYQVTDFYFYVGDENNAMELYVKVNEHSNMETYKFNGEYFELQKMIQLSNNSAFNHFQIHDFDNDGLPELITLSYASYSFSDFLWDLKVYSQNDESTFNEVFNIEYIEKLYYFDNYYLFYFNNSWFLKSFLDSLGVIVNDFDGDNKKDIYFAGKIYYYRDFSFLPGLNYDPSHSGHGFSIEPVGSLGEFYTVFYTYGDDGFPEWYSDLGVFEQTEGDYWNISSNRSGFIRYQYDYNTNTASKNQDELEKGYIAQAQCSDDYGSIGINFNKKFNPTFVDYIDKINWCSQANIPYEQRPNDNISGLWWAGLNDSGWGWSMSLQERADTTALVVVLYYYDGQGNPRWLLGVQEGFEFGQEISVEMNMFNGYARAATPVALTTTAAGTMQFTINNPAGTNTYTGTMSMDVSYPGAEGGHWQRDNIAISRQSNPRR